MIGKREFSFFPYFCQLKLYSKENMFHICNLYLSAKKVEQNTGAPCQLILAFIASISLSFSASLSSEKGIRQLCTRFALSVTGSYFQLCK